MASDPLRHVLTCLLLSLPGAAMAQGPLSAIDWLSDSVILPAPVAMPRAAPATPPEPDVAISALPEQITVSPLGAPSPDSVGLVPARRLGLPDDLWGASSSVTLARRLGELDIPQLPALRELLKSMLIAELDPPTDSGSDRTLFLARIDALLSMGALSEASELLDRAGRTEPDYFRRWFDISLLTGTENRACTRMRALPKISPTYAARIFCLARGGDWQAAALTLGTAKALGLVDPREDELLGRFLLDELTDHAAPLPHERNPTPLVFSMYAAVGEPIATGNLPIAFAHADLRPVTGWKPRIAAAERLARAGVLTGDTLIAIYSEREPAASGGVWERVQAMQVLGVALDHADEPAIAAALPDVWHGAKDTETEVALADALSDLLSDLPLTGAAADIRLQLALLSETPSNAAAPEAPTPDQAFWLALAAGTPEATVPSGDLAIALRDGFLAEGAPVRLQSLLDQNRKGEAILRAFGLFRLGADGNFDALQDAVALLRAVGLGDVATRAALHLLILDRRA
ncbi:hypothetical protein [Oceaniovalibus sp. ACAM 378]|uniref:hypothetical protein n=1 Tax=Oceaniovalibus sp. ACAM 378 TaxID=2599923 RepID=UPI0011D4A64E|nr:hypothetical protein [Oceaniovalibus sp. ACAM 378]TYB89817.1 hypothetical protein FQ320_06780 [Oceaniovalibus sp. ACAM 378]